MGIKTEDMCKGIPPKEPTPNIDWLRILDDFDPSTLNDRFLNECARRNPNDTCYRWSDDGLPSMPIEERLKHSKSGLEFDRRDLARCSDRINEEGLTTTNYKLARQTLIKAIGSKGAVEYNQREYEALGEDGRVRQAEEYRRWEEERQRQRASEEAEFEERLESGLYDFYEEPPASLHEKVVRVRKGILGTNGKPLTQRQFAKLISYPINKYAEAEKTDRWSRHSNRDEESEVEYELLEKLVMIAHANPYWLFDDEVDADWSEYDPDDQIVRDGDIPCVYAKADVILKWIEAGKPRSTYWVDGVRL